MLQAAAYCSQPLVYGHSHFKKFWLRQTESEDDVALAAQHGSSSSASGDELLHSQRSSDSELDGDVGSNARSLARACARCGTMKTPLWRNGPQGPKSLCNACGIRFKKASKRNMSAESSLEVLDSLPSSPSSAKTCTGKCSKRKVECSIILPRDSWEVETRKKVVRGDSSRKQWKRNRASEGLDSADSSEHDVDEALGSSETSTLTWEQRASSSACIIPELSMPLLGVGSHLSLSGFGSMGHSLFREESKSRMPGRKKAIFAQDEEEGAKLLMALSCGLVNA